MTSEGLMALNKLSCNQAITIKPADKGRAVVVWDTVSYIEEANRQLFDSKVYRSLERDPRWDIEKQIVSVLKIALDNGVIDSDLFDFFPC